jgi:chromosome segregation ATPase
MDAAVDSLLGLFQGLVDVVTECKESATASQAGLESLTESLQASEAQLKLSNIQSEESQLAAVQADANASTLRTEVNNLTAELSAVLEKLQLKEDEIQRLENSVSALQARQDNDSTAAEVRYWSM